MKLRNCWTRNIREAQGGSFAGTRILHNCDGNQSINPPTMAAQRCGSETWNLTVATGANQRGKTPPPFLKPIMSECLLANEGGKLTRQHDRRRYQRRWELGAAWIITLPDTCLWSASTERVQRDSRIKGRKMTEENGGLE